MLTNFEVCKIHGVENKMKYTTGYPLHRENRENGQKNSVSEKTQGIWFAQVVNSLILKVKDILKFAAKFTNFFKA